MKTKKEIVENWLPRYTGKRLEDIGKYILLTNFQGYVEKFAQRFEVHVDGVDKNMPNATAEGITIINFGMGSPNAATIMDLLSAIRPKAVLFLGKCGGLKKKNKLGDLILPIAAIRNEGTSNDYMPPEIPALPAFNLQRAVSHIFVIQEKITGQALYLPPTEGYGNLTTALKSILQKHGQLPSIWKRQRFLPLDFPIKFQPALYCLFPTNP